MFDKLERINRFSQNFEYSIHYLIRYISTSYRNLSLINTNLPLVTPIICSCLRKNNLRFIKPSFNKIRSYGTLGDFLRFYMKNQEQEHYDVLVLDFYETLADLYDNEEELAESININRDLFSKIFNSTIVIAPPNVVYRLKRRAIDFWSCLDNYIDTTKWLSCPVTLPIVKIRVLCNTSSLFITLYQNDSEAFFKYTQLKNEIFEVSEYSSNKFYELYKQIVDFHNDVHYPACYVDLLLCFIDKMTTVKVSKSNVNERFIDFDNLLEKGVNERDKNEYLPTTLDLVDGQIMLAEFYYKSGKYSDAITRYKIAMDVLNDKWDENEVNSIILTYLNFNIIICNYMLKRTHSPQSLIDELEQRLSNCKMLSEEYDSFGKTFLLLVDFAVQHHSYIQHSDVLKQLKNSSITKLPMMDISESFDCVLSWEIFIEKDFSPIKNKRKESELLSAYYEIQNMINHFVNNDYHKARKSYTHVNKKLIELGFLQIQEMTSLIWNNIQYLHKCSKKL